MLTHAFRIRKVTRETYDTFSLELRPEKGVDRINFKPGQFNMLYVFGIGEVPISISGDPGDENILVHTVRAVGSVTKAMKRLKAGDVIGVRGPYGTAWPVDEAAGCDVAVIAGGIGLAPLRPTIYHLLTNREKYGKVVLLYGARTPEEILFGSDLKKWRSRFDIDLQVTVDRATGSWMGNVGVVTTLIGKAPFDPLHCMVMVCGPEIMMRFTVLELQKRGIKEDDIYVSMERNMKCGVGLCGHCQIGSIFVCKDGPVFPYSRVKELFARREF
jgi:NAD(P)H-flavin reductase